MKKGLFYIFLGGTLMACGTGEESESITNDGEESSVVEIVTPEETEGSNNINNSIEHQSQIEGMELTTIEYFDVTHNFGNVFYPSDNKFTFKFKNTGNVPLIIDEATASCGCTIPNKPDEPILPGSIGELDVIFRPKSGQVGTEVTKKITVVANTNPKETYLEISAKVMDAM